MLVKTKNDSLAEVKELFAEVFLAERGDENGKKLPPIIDKDGTYRFDELIPQNERDEKFLGLFLPFYKTNKKMVNKQEMASLLINDHFYNVIIRKDLSWTIRKSKVQVEESI